MTIETNHISQRWYTYMICIRIIQNDQWIGFISFYFVVAICFFFAAFRQIKIIIIQWYATKYTVCNQYKLSSPLSIANLSQIRNENKSFLLKKLDWNVHHNFRYVYFRSQASWHMWIIYSCIIIYTTWDLWNHKKCLSF